jgi:hypothetical protein
LYAKWPDLHTERRRNEQLYAKWADLHTESRNNEQLREGKTKRNIIE